MSHARRLPNGQVDFRRKQITVKQAVWNGIVDSPKSGKGSVIPMTNALEAVLRSLRHSRGERVLWEQDAFASAEALSPPCKASPYARAESTA